MGVPRAENQQGSQRALECGETPRSNVEADRRSRPASGQMHTRPLEPEHRRSVPLETERMTDLGREGRFRLSGWGVRLGALSNRWSTASWRTLQPCVVRSGDRPTVTMAQWAERRSGLNRWRISDWMKRTRQRQTLIAEDQKEQTKVRNVLRHPTPLRLLHARTVQDQGLSTNDAQEMRRQPDQVWLAVHTSGEQLQIAARLES